MAISKLDRARQFLPFDALKGFQEALHEKEIIYDEKVELAEDALEELSETFTSIMPGDELEITYYYQKFYIQKHGTLLKIDYQKKKLILDNDLIIPISNILKLNVV